MINTPQGTTLRDLAKSKGWTYIQAAEWLCGEIRAGRVKRYWRIDYAIYKEKRND